MLRFLLAPRRMVLHLVASVLVVAMSLLGFWQLNRALASGEPSPAADPPPVALSSLTVPGQLLPGQAYGRRVTLSGTFDPRHEVLAPDRELAGERGSWVVTPLRTRDGPAVVVVRGWAESRADVAPPSAGPVRVRGRVYPSEQSAPGQGRLGRPVDTRSLAARLPYALADGYVIAIRQRPDAAGTLEQVPARPWPSEAAGFPLQNAAYAVQWWLFAMFVCFMWWRVLRDQWKRDECGADRTGMNPVTPVHDQARPIGRA